MNRYDFIQHLQNRSKKFALDALVFCETLDSRVSNRVISYQLAKSATSFAANYRAACRARSHRKFISKLSISLEEVDESLFWLELLNDKHKTEDLILLNLMKEATELTKVLSTARKNSRSRKDTTSPTN